MHLKALIFFIIFCAILSAVILSGGVKKNEPDKEVSITTSSIPAGRMESVIFVASPRYGEYKITDGPLIETLNYLKRIAGIETEIELRSYMPNTEYDKKYGPRSAVIRKNEKGRPIISVGEYLYTNQASLDARLALLAHELGHLQLGHCLKNSQISADYLKDSSLAQARADLFAINLIGRETFVSGFKELGIDIRQRMKIVILLQTRQKYLVN